MSAPLPQTLSDPENDENLDDQAKCCYGNPEHKPRGLKMERSGKQEDKQQPFEDEHSGCNSSR